MNSIIVSHLKDATSCRRFTLLSDEIPFHLRVGFNINRYLRLANENVYKSELDVVDEYPSAVDTFYFTEEIKCIGLLRFEYVVGAIKESIKIVRLYDNQIHSRNIEFYSNGFIESDVNMLNGVIHGKSVKYHNNGKIFKESTFNYGKLNGVSSLYNTEGEKISEEIYENNILIKTINHSANV